jgi:hypothetical protein
MQLFPGFQSSNFSVSKKSVIATQMIAQSHLWNKKRGELSCRGNWLDQKENMMALKNA